VSEKATAMERFVRESNRIEGILREPLQREIDAHAAFLALRMVTLADLEAFVADIAGVPLRRVVGQDVRVGGHVPPPGGPVIERELNYLLRDVATGRSPYEVHVDYELLHPFMDGNGRSGRVLWAWQMRDQGQDPFSLPFLHRFYYQTLDAARTD
jgi:hypothetical protein